MPQNPIASHAFILLREHHFIILRAVKTLANESVSERIQRELKFMDENLSITEIDDILNWLHMNGFVQARHIQGEQKGLQQGSTYLISARGVQALSYADIHGVDEISKSCKVPISIFGPSF